MLKSVPSLWDSTHFHDYQKTAHSFWIHVIQMVLDKLDAGIEVRCVEFVWNVPSQGTKLSPFLDNGMQEGNTKQHRFPLWHV